MEVKKTAAAAQADSLIPPLIEYKHKEKVSSLSAIEQSIAATAAAAVASFTNESYRRQLAGKFNSRGSESTSTSTEESSLPKSDSYGDLHGCGESSKLSDLSLSLGVASSPNQSSGSLSLDLDPTLDSVFSLSQDHLLTGDSGCDMDLIHPPGGSAGGSRVLARRGPGRPRKDAMGVSVVLNKSIAKGFRRNKTSTSGAFGNLQIRGRVKVEGFASGFGPVSVSDLNSLSQSPPRANAIDDTAESDTSSVASSLEKLHEDFSLFPEKWPGCVCAFCNLGEKSMLGQGDLIRMETPIGFDPQRILKEIRETKAKTNDIIPSIDLMTITSSIMKRQKGGSKIKRLTSQNSIEGSHAASLEEVGYHDEPKWQDVFTANLTGYSYFVHSNCTSWSRSKRSDEENVEVEIEVLRALVQTCSFCRRFGAGVGCSESSCAVALHFPCIALSASFRETQAKKMVCFLHLESVIPLFGNEANCTVCDLSTDLPLMVTCSSCGHHYHTHCMALNPEPDIRAGWQCPACKVCQSCRQPGDESKLLACDTCDKTYHIFCLRPSLSAVPKHSWKCKVCRVCTDCGARTPGSGPSSRWHTNFSVCDSCYQQRNKGLACPLCGKAYRHVAQKLMLQCNSCKKFVHKECDERKKDLVSDKDYVCSLCNQLDGSSKISPSGKPSGLVVESVGSNPGHSHSHVADHPPKQELAVLAYEDSLGRQTSTASSASDEVSTLTSTPVPIPPPLPPHKSPYLANVAMPTTPAAPQKRRNGMGRLKSTDKCAMSTVGRRQRFSEIARKRGPKPKLRGAFGTSGIGLGNSHETSKGDDEPGVENRLVLCSAEDDFVLKQDTCVMCGAFGNDFEGRLISCAQCGQCYHPYCVNVKVTKVILQKGWRCLDCTVCEGCGQRNDEARLILCDDCDISYHTYCMNPPLEQVPQGNWKCKWCAVCQVCGSNSPGKNSKWHKNYSVCGPCNSMSMCPICRLSYSDGDFIINCQNCERWLHGVCDGINNEDDAEKCLEIKYSCILCRPPNTLPPHLAPPPASLKEISKNNDGINSRALVQIDGVSLSESGVSHIKSLTLDQPRKKRKKVSTGAEAEAGILDAIESVVANSVSSFDKQHGKDSDGTLESTDNDAKKRQRTLQKFGVGGFLLRLRGGRFKDDEDSFADGTEGTDKPKRRPARRKVKNKVVESFPTYLQEAFFGKELMDCGKENELGQSEASSSNGLEITTDTKRESVLSLSKDELQVLETVKTERVEFQELLPLSSELLDNDLVDTIMGGNNGVKVGEGIDDGGNQARRHADVAKDELNDFFGAQFNLESMDTGLPSMDGKDVEDIFKGVLTDESQESQDAVFSAPSSLPTSGLLGATGMTPSTMTMSMPPTPNPNPGFQSINHVSMPSGHPGGHGGGSVQGIVRSTSLPASVPTGLASPVSFPPPSPYHSEYSNSPQFSPAFSEPPSPWPSAIAEGETDQPSGTYSQRSILKWEVDESLNAGATISAVLYANMNHPELKRDYPNWTERAKQIAKIWRGLPADKRAPYLQKARENRAAGRIQKAQTQSSKERESNHPKGSINETDSAGNMSQSSLNQSPKIPQIDFMISSIPIGGGSLATSSGSLPLPRRTITAFPTQSAPRTLPSATTHLQISMGSTNKVTFHTVPTSQSQLLTNAKGLESLDMKGSSVADQQIRVLTPSEIMQTLPALHQENYRFSPSPLGLEQDKASASANTGPLKGIRAETPEERQWKQMQVYRQQQQHATLNNQKLQMDGKPDGLGVSVVGNMSPSMQFQHSPLQRQLSTDGSQPSQASTSMDQKLTPPPMSPPRLLHTTGPRQLLSPLILQQQTNRARIQLQQDMPPPNPSLSLQYPPKINLSQLPSTVRTPSGYARLPYMRIPKPPTATDNLVAGKTDSSSPLDLYPTSGAIRIQLSDGSGSSVRKPDGSNPPIAIQMGPQGARQHLRDLLQRQQNKKGEQDHAAQETAIEGISQTQMGSQRWTQEDWQKSTLMESISGQNYELKVDGTSHLPSLQGVPRAGEFRQPIAPQIRLTPRGPTTIRTSMADFSHLHMLNQQGTGPRLQSLVQQQQQPGQGQPRTLMALQQSGVRGGRPVLFQVQPQTSRFPMHGVVLGQAGSQESTPAPTHRNILDTYSLLTKDSSSSMLAQQLGRPLDSRGGPQSHLLAHVNTMDTSRSVALDTGSHVLEASGDVPPSIPGGVHQELPDNVAAELEKLEQENGDATVEGDGSDLGIDDDELLGMGADFNILEYADPELDQVVGGEKTNILDNLDLEVEKDEEKAPKSKEDSERGTKKESGVEFGSLSSGESRTLGSSLKLSEHHPGGPPRQDHMRTQPPPPYPGPPPPYPGRDNVSVGVRNGEGIGLQSTSSPMLSNNLVKFGTSGGGPPPNVVPFAQMGSNSIPSHATLSPHQRRTLLLQEQPLLLEDLLEQEKREQQRQGPSMSGMPTSEEHLLNDFDFERLNVMGTNIVQQQQQQHKLPPTLTGQSILGSSLGAMYNRSQSQSSTESHSDSGSSWNVDKSSLHTLATPSSSNPAGQSIQLQGATAAGGDGGANRVISFPIQSMPAPPMPPEIPLTEQDRQMEIKYEQWLYHQQHVLTVQLKYFDTEVNKLRKSKKSFNSKQRQLKKNGAELNEADATELDKIVRELNRLQKHLDSARKQSRQHGILAQEYRNKQQKRQKGNMSPGSNVPGGGPSLSPLHSTPQSPMMSPSPSPFGGPSPSPLQQNSPMASPLNSSPGSVTQLPAGSLAQMSPRNSGFPPLDDRPFSPNSTNTLRFIPSVPPMLPNQSRLPNQMVSSGGGGQIRMVSAASQQQSSGVRTLMSIPGQSMGVSMMVSRGINLNNLRPSDTTVATTPDQMQGGRILQLPTRLQFPRGAGNPPQDMIRSRMMHHGFQTQQAQHFVNVNPPRAVYSSQSPPGGVNISMTPIRSPSPLAGLGSPGNTGASSQGISNSPVNSPMRRSSGGGIGSPLPPGRPRSVENPLTPRSSGPGSGPQTPAPTGSTPLVASSQSFEAPSTNVIIQPINEPSDNSKTEAQAPTPEAPPPGSGGGGGNVAAQVVPIPVDIFSWFKGPGYCGLRGGSPFSVVTSGVGATATAHQDLQLARATTTTASVSEESAAAAAAAVVSSIQATISTPPGPARSNSNDSETISESLNENSLQKSNSSSSDVLDEIQPTSQSQSPNLAAIATKGLDHSAIPELVQDLSFLSNSGDGDVANANSSASQTQTQTSVPSTPSTSSGSSLNASTDSQNALLKQLLQNTGCASTSQVQPDTSGFSLPLCLPGRSTNVASHLSEAATRIPQPTPPIRLTEATAATTNTTTTPTTAISTPLPLPSKSPPVINIPKVGESDAALAPSLTATIVEVPVTAPTPASVPPVTKATNSVVDSTLVERPLFSLPNSILEIRTSDAPNDFSTSFDFTSTVKDGSTTNTLVTDITLTSPIIPIPKRNDDESRKAKRRQYQAKRRQSTGKDSTTQPKKRSRKGSKVEEDYDTYIDTLMTQLRLLVPVGIVEPVLAQNYSSCCPPGTGDLTKPATNKDYNIHLGELEGALFWSSTKSSNDFYTSRGSDDHSSSYRPTPTTQNQPFNQRGFYNQEFSLPSVLIAGFKRTLDLKSPSPVRDTDSPDTIISSSSPEYDSSENVDPYPGLKYIDTIEDELGGSRSPEISLTDVPCHFVPLTTSEATAEIENNKENKLGDSTFTRPRVGSNAILRENGNIVVTLTVSPNAAQDVANVLRNLANILSVSPLSVYQVEHNALGAQKIGIFSYKSKDGKETIDLQGILNGTAKFCKHCDIIVLNNAIKKNLSGLDKSVAHEDEVSFCGQSCLTQFYMTNGISLSSEKLGVGAVINHVGGDANNANGGIDKFCTTKSLKRNLSDGPAVDNADSNGTGAAKRWKDVKYKKWSSNCQLTPKYKKPTEKELTDMLFRLGITVRMPLSSMPEDSRKCCLCHQFGDAVSDGAARLLNLDVDKWVHLNCALWSDEVYETESGALVNVELALKQSLNLGCVACNKNGATVKCFKVRCTQVYHLGCAVKDGCVFYQNKTVYCSAHIPKGEKENELTTLKVSRRVYIQRDENRQVAAVMHHADQKQLLRVGSLIFLSVGQLLPHQLHAFHSPNYIYPIGYKIIRFYWSMTRINTRCQYECSIHEVDGKPEFRVMSKEESAKETTLTGSTATEVWRHVLDIIAKLRESSGCIKLFPKYITGEDLFGLTEPTIVKVLESLPGVETLNDYHFKYGRNPLLELPLAINPTGCARSEPKLRTHFKRPHTQKTGGARANFPTSIISSSETTCPYSKQFVHSKSSQYKKMKQDWRNNVYLARSKIQGLGLYAARDIEKHTMVIEYIGEIIRSELAETREKKYEAQNRGIYMFRVDEDRVIDATLCGGLARYINHSCNPNCVAETVEVDRDLRIIIFSNRRICRGEELAYDYKFEFEDDGHKIPCCCGAVNCREWMN